MTDPAATTKDDQSTLKVPADIVDRFGDLIKLIKASKSMDDSERQYWIDVLPIMSDDQIQNLRDILDNEKKQLAEAEASYADGTQESFLKATKAFDAAAYKEKKLTRVQAEKVHEKEEADLEAAILKELEGL